MMFLPFNNPIWFYRNPVDFRAQIDGLAILVADTLRKAPTSGQLFIFRNRQADKIKILVWDSDGFWLLYKRLEQSRFKFPNINDEAIELTLQELQWLLSGLDFTQQKKPLKLQYSAFY